MEKQKSTISNIIIDEEKMHTTSLFKHNILRSSRSFNTRMVQNFLVVWTDANLNKINDSDCCNTITNLRQVVNTVYTLTDIDECIDLITDIDEEKVFVISSGAFDQTVMSIVHDVSQISSIYILCENKAQHEQWIKQLPKVEGVFRDIQPICKALKKAVHECDHNTISMSFIDTTADAVNKKLDQLDQSFMYTQILKEILLTIDFKQEHLEDFIIYCREILVNNPIELKNLDKLEKEYHQHTPIWWYTYHSFLYSMLNKSLRTMEVDLIIKLGFFVCDLHKHVAQLHSEQYGEYYYTDLFIVYRGQGVSQRDFDQLIKTKGGLLSFNNFLSTSKNSQVSLRFARRTTATSDLVGILFVITIDPSIPSTPFANVRNISYYQTEDEILFSMHSIFRIREIKAIDRDNRLWLVDLTLTSDNDPQLHALTKCMREETSLNAKGWYRLGCLLIKLGEFDKAQQVYDAVLDQTSNHDEKANIYHMIARIKENQGEYVEAIRFYEKSLKIQQDTLPSNHLHFPTSYNNIGGVYDKLGKYSKALWYYEKALLIYQETLPPNHPHLATSYNNIGLLHHKMGEYSRALSFYEKAVEIYQQTLPPNHPHLATSYDNMGRALNKMGEYSKALSSCNKALEIDQKTLPPNHPDLAHSYNNIGLVYKNMGDYSKALSYYEEALEIQQKVLPSNHPDLATSYNNLGLLYEDMGEYPKALSFHEKALEIRQKTFSSDHPQLALSYAGIGKIYYNMGDYSKALPFFEHAVDIGQRSLPANHPDLQQYNLGLEKIKEKL